MFLIRSDYRSEQGTATTVVSGTGGTVILGPFEVGAFVNRSISIHNLGPATLSGVLVQVSNDTRGNEANTPTHDGRGSAPLPSLWATTSDITTTSLPAGSIAHFNAIARYSRWLQIVGIADGPGVTVSGYLYAI